MQWAEWAIDASDKHGGGVITPGVVLAQVKAESSFDPNVVQEWSGAQGASQFMPDTIKWLKGAGIIDSNMDPFNPADSIPAQVRYMKWIHDNQTSKKIPNADRRTSRQLTAAGYNAGPNRARRWQPEFQSIAADQYTETIPLLETRDYVKHVMTNATYYGILLGQGAQSVGKRMQAIPLRNTP